MNLAQMTSDASGLTGTNPTAPVNTTREGDWFQPPFVDARRSSLKTNDLRLPPGARRAGEQLLQSQLGRVRRRRSRHVNAKGER